MSEEEILQPIIPSDPESPPWDRTLKIFVATATVLMLVAFAMRFQNLILQIAAAAIIAYVATPFIDLLAKKSPLGRGTAILVTYIIILIMVTTVFVAFGTTVFNQVLNLVYTVPDFVEGTVEWFATTDEISIGPYSIDIAAFWARIDHQLIQEQLIPSIGSIVRQTGGTLIQVLSSGVQVGTQVLFTIVISIYLAFEIPNLGSYVERAAQRPGYGRDARLLTHDFGRIWRAYLRGQVILGLIIGTAVWISLTILGVQNAFGLGVISGLLEFLPIIGPIIGTAAAAIVAFLQPANYLGLEPVTYVLVIIGVMILIQQIENNLLVPRIVGGALDLHPVIIIVGVFIGGAMAGLIGAILAAPLLATVKLLGTYAWRKMFDLPPFPEGDEFDYREPGPTLLSRLWKRIANLRRTSN
ncbi:MAG TPA: AI-2E family transporter [candidate division Zixibacteria bacterium]|nr:AI-2E family transporter [candidate division Zixibacteria bacterium]